MLLLYEELWRRFPEIRGEIEGESEFPYVIVGALASYLAEQNTQDVTPELISRIVEFTEWCQSQPEGKSASDDVFTILTVAFFEHLFERESTRMLLPSLVNKEVLQINADYLKSWVGEDNYNLAMAEYFKRR